MILMSYLLHYDLILINGKWLIYILFSLTYVLVRSICCELNASGISVSVFIFNYYYYFIFFEILKIVIAMLCHVCLCM